MMMDKTRIDLTAIGILAIIICAAYFTFFRAERSRVAVLRQEEAALTETLAARGGTELALDKIAEEIRTIQSNLEQFEQQLPGESRIHDFLRTLDTLAREARVELTAITPQGAVREARYSRIPVMISGRARFTDFYRFLYQLERIPRITKVQSLNVSRSREGRTGAGGDPFCDIRVNLSVFVSGG